jgi:hypothetical protein
MSSSLWRKQTRVDYEESLVPFLAGDGFSATWFRCAVSNVPRKVQSWSCTELAYAPTFFARRCTLHSWITCRTRL